MAFALPAADIGLAAPADPAADIVVADPEQDTQVAAGIEAAADTAVWQAGTLAAEIADTRG